MPLVIGFQSTAIQHLWFGGQPLVNKAAHNLPPADPSREAAQIARLRRLATDAKLDPDFAEALEEHGSVVRRVLDLGTGPATQAVALARRYASPEAGTFVNGILGAAARTRGTGR